MPLAINQKNQHPFQCTLVSGVGRNGDQVGVLVNYGNILFCDEFTCTGFAPSDLKKQYEPGFYSNNVEVLHGYESDDRILVFLLIISEIDERKEERNKKDAYKLWEETYKTGSGELIKEYYTDQQWESVKHCSHLNSFFNMEFPNNFSPLTSDSIMPNFDQAYIKHEIIPKSLKDEHLEDIQIDFPTQQYFNFYNFVFNRGGGSKKDYSQAIVPIAKIESGVLTQLLHHDYVFSLPYIYNNINLEPFLG